MNSKFVQHKNLLKKAIYYQMSKHTHQCQFHTSLVRCDFKNMFLIVVVVIVSIFTTYIQMLKYKPQTHIPPTQIYFISK